MTDLRSSRWNLGFIAMRWRHVFWILPLAGLLIGMVVHVVDYQRKNVATGIVQLRPLPFLSFGFSECLTLIKSDEVLESTSRELELPARWNMDSGQTLDALRRLVECGQVPGTSLISISIKGRKSPETVELCTALTGQADKAVALLVSKENEKVWERREKEMERVEARERIAKERLAKMTMESGSLNLARSWTDAEFDDARQQLEEAQKDRHDWTSLAMSGSGRPGFEFISHPRVIEHELPHMASPSLSWRIQEAAIACGIGLGAGMVLALILAYLLELLIPRKSGEGLDPAA